MSVMTRFRGCSWVLREEVSSNVSYLTKLMRFSPVLLRHVTEQLSRLHGTSTHVAPTHHSPVPLLPVLAREAVPGQVEKGYSTSILWQTTFPTFILSEGG